MLTNFSSVMNLQWRIDRSSKGSFPNIAINYINYETRWIRADT